jgi:hypothetical protein
MAKLRAVLLVLFTVALVSVTCIDGCGKDKMDTGLANTINMWVSVDNVDLSWLHVKVKPTINAKADTRYVVDLYENERLRDSSSVSFNRPQPNVAETEVVRFPLSKTEADAYLSKGGLAHLRGGRALVGF